ncbi:DUF1963 domain-containing protein [Paenibacillus sp. GSMTC-2017]|nr:DUF1963 domain-containing protein [Paenibacillus sp. GSMTC-2017]
MSNELILQLLEKAGLEKYKQSIATWIYPTAQLILEPVLDTYIPVGSSKVGGNPDLLENVNWPIWKKYDMTFIAQINLDECPFELDLPCGGLLSFFYAVKPMFEDIEFFGDPDTCHVVYTEVDQLDRLIRRETPDLECVKMKSNKISFIPGLSVPTSESAYLESQNLGWNGNIVDYEKYWNVFLHEYRKHWDSESYINRLMGHPDQIQGDMQVSCVKAYGEHTREDMQDSKVRNQIVNSALKWRLLLQIDSEEDKTGIMWGDVGRIYFWIHEDDLKALRFDRVNCEMQCT